MIEPVLLRKTTDQWPWICQAFDRADQLKILFVGENIIDDYRYVTSLGKASKEWALASIQISQEEWRGGAYAASLHAEWPKAIYEAPVRALRKTRYVDADFKRKLFEVYSTEKLQFSVVEANEFRRHLTIEVKNADVVIVLDFGHGLLKSEERDILCSAKFLAVNSQTNAGNYGFNPVTLYPRADLICIDEPEARLAAGLRDEKSLPRLTREIRKRTVCSKFIITRGKNGITAIEHSEDKDIYQSVEIPALEEHGLDTMGAGDAVMATAAPLVAAGLDLQAATLVGNVAGALKVGIIGHSSHVTRKDLLAAVQKALA